MRVIQDSDDEFEEDIEIIPSLPTAVDASTSQHERAKDASSGGTGSTGTCGTKHLYDYQLKLHQNHLKEHLRKPTVSSFRILQVHLGQVNRNLRHHFPSIQKKGGRLLPLSVLSNRPTETAQEKDL